MLNVGCSLSASSLTQSVATLLPFGVAASGRSMRIKLEKTERSRGIK